MKTVFYTFLAMLAGVLAFTGIDKSGKPASKDAVVAEENTPTPAPETNVGGGEWAQWGRNGTNNMSSPATGIPMDLDAGEIDDEGKAEGAKHLKWVAELGSHAYGTPTIKDGRVFVGTNNEKPRDETVQGDRGIVMCFDEQSGEFQWELAVPKLDAGKVSDWEFLGICSSVAVDGKYGYVVTNRGEVLAIDVYGMSDGNDGPFEDEAKYMNGGLEKLAQSEPAELDDKSGDIVWGFDMRSELGVFPHNITSSSVTFSDKYVYVTTSNGVDWSHTNVPAPLAPCFIVLDKETGELVAEEDSIDGQDIMHCNWSSPAYVPDLAGKQTVVFGAGDGYCYGFDANTFEEKDDNGFKYSALKELWKVNCCPNDYRFDEEGKPIKYATYPGPSEIIASPVVYNDKVYAAIGQDPEHGEGVGALTCINPAKGTGDEAMEWQFKEIKRTISTPSVVDGLVYIADYSGRVFCLDAETGQKYWEHDTLSHIWGSTMVVDGKVLIGTEDGELVILKAGKQYEELGLVTFPSPIYSTPVIANGAMYVMCMTHLYAFELGE